jgi:clan AA aspartic protease
VISGSVNDDLESYVPLTVTGPLGSVHFQALVDTGFNESLTLPPHLVRTLGLPFEVTAEATLDDGSTTTFDSFVGTVLWLGEEREVIVLSADGGPLLGMALVHGCDLNIEMISGGRVTIVPRA